jgi:hypothetical protein
MVVNLLHAETLVVTSPDADLAKERMKLILADRVLPQEADIRRRIPALQHHCLTTRYSVLLGSVF